LRFFWRARWNRCGLISNSLFNMWAILAKEDNGFMLRDPSLIPLSRQHHRALALCVRLQRALQAGAVDPRVWQAEAQQLYADEVQFHFAAEEKVLFPAARQFSELAALVEELSVEHEQLRNYFVHAEDGKIDEGGLAIFAELLSSHIRKEERQLFEVMQQRLRPAELKSLGHELERALKEAVQVCRLRPGIAG
jgi:hemerythrin-like domain-containing protein